MREIKFRAWDREHGMISGDNFLGPRPEISVTLSSPTSYRLNEFFKEPRWVFMQYTGMKDANGREVYEGDILKTAGNPHVVEWLDNAAYTDDATGYKKIAYFWEIIGNIYENPDLLV